MLKIKYLPTISLKLNEKNPRRNDNAVEYVSKSIKEFGFTSPILLDKEGVVIAGHTRVKAALKNGLVEVPTIELSNLTPAQAKAYMIADNKLNELAEWDTELLKDLLHDLPPTMDVEAMGFSLDEIEKLFGAELPEFYDESKEDDVLEEVPAICKLGDVWKLGEHKLMCGDATNKENVNSLFAGNKASLCFTSPPYSDQRTYKGNKDLTIEYISNFISVSADLCELFAVNLGMSRKDGEVIQYWDDYIKKAKESGLKLLSWNVWDKGNGGSVGNLTAMFAITHEWIFVFGKNRKELNKTYPNKHGGAISNHATVRQRDGKTTRAKIQITNDFSQLNTIYQVIRQAGNDKIDHPARFPVEFPKGYIDACTNPGDWVYEPFCGSGTTLIACEKTNRKCLAMELDQHYCDVIITRWETMTNKKAEIIC